MKNKLLQKRKTKPHLIKAWVKVYGFILIFLISTNLYAFALPDVPITGKVIDEKGVGIPGASILVKGTTIGASSDADGNFKLSVPENSTLVVSSIGYKTIEVISGNQTELTIILKSTVTELDQVVVVGYGTQKKADITGSISSIKGEDLSKQSSVNPLSSLQGRMAGVQVTNSGQPGTGPQIRIRGTGSAQGGVEPLYVVDGVFVNDISFLNANDIESIDVLKDASSASIFGVRAANGVVLITTKRAKAGKMLINYNGYIGVQRVTNQVKMASAKKYATLINEKIGTPTFGEYPTTDWYKQILRPFALINNQNINISGSTEKSNYNFSLGYVKQEGVLKKNDFERITARLQNDIIFSKSLKVGYNALLNSNTSNDIPGDIFYQAFVAPPIIPVYELNGRYGDSFNYKTGNFANPQATLDWFNQKSNGQSIVGNIYGEVKILKDFTFRSNLGLSFKGNRSTYYQTQDSLTTTQHSSVGTLNKNSSRASSWIWENTLTYDKTIGFHRFKALIGYGSQKNTSEDNGASILGVPNAPEYYYLNSGNKSSIVASNGGDKSSIISYFARINYAYNDKYLLTATIRRDGSSKFPKNNRFGNFPSFGLGWVVTNEDFLKDQNIINYLKLKGSWGKLGNSNIISNIFQQVATSDPTLYYPFGGNFLQGQSIISRPPQTLYWEVINETDIGAEMSFLHNRLFIETDYYDKRTVNAIFTVPVLGSNGLVGDGIMGNYATFQNKGFEFSATWKETSGKLKYNIGFNTSINKNRILSLATGDQPFYSGELPVGGYFATYSKPGTPIGSFYGYQVEGIFQSDAEATSSAQPAAHAGDFKYKDINGDGVIDSKDKILLGNPNPRVTYGISSGFSYGNFDFQLDIQGVAGVELYNANKGIRVGNENFTDDFYQHRWHGSGTSNSYPSANLSGSNLDPNSWFVEKGDYIRIRTVQLGYNVSNKLIEKWKMQKLRIYLNAQNPYTYFKYHGFTPEIQAKSPTSAGIDQNVYPLSATYNLGLNLTF